MNRVVDIQGAGPGLTVIDADQAGRVFNIQSSAVVTLTDLTVTNGWASNGAGIRNNQGTVSLVNTHIVANTAAATGGAVGGGIYNLLGTMTVISTTMTHLRPRFL